MDKEMTTASASERESAKLLQNSQGRLQPRTASKQQASELREDASYGPVEPAVPAAEQPLSATSAAQLVARAAAGDDAAFLELMAASRDRLLRIAIAYLRSEEAALEAIQETTLRAYMKLDKLKEPAYFHTWLVRILMNACMDEQKRLRRQRPTERLPERTAADPLIDDRLRMEDAIGELEPKLRQVVILKYYEDMTLTDIARLLKKPEGTVKTWLNKALGKLRADMREGEERNG